MRHLLMITVSFLALAGCRSIMDPTFMPAGYSFHSDTYKAPPGPMAKGIGYDFSPSMNETVVAQWKTVAAAMAGRLQSELGIGPQRIYVEMLPDRNAFNSSFDYALRDELRARGYTLVMSPAGVPSLRPEAYQPGDVHVPVDANAYNGDPQVLDIPEHREDPATFIVSLTALSGQTVTGEVSGEFTMPGYGYVRGEGQDRIDPRLPKKEVPPPAPKQGPADTPPDYAAPEPLLFDGAGTDEIIEEKI